MRTALHPFRDVPITVSEYVKEFGHSPINDRQIALPRARCTFCRREMLVRGLSSPGSVAHFAHFADKSPCPTKQLASRAYRNCLPAHPDQRHALWLQQQFWLHWQNHYRVINNLVKNLWPSEFGNLLKEANRLRIWEYAELREYEIPYVLCTLADFPPQASPKPNPYLRRKWFRFWFDTQAKNFNELWINGDRPSYLWVAYYEPPTGRQKLPGIDALINAYRAEIDTGCLDASYHLSTKLVNLIIPMLKQHLKI